MDDIRLGRVVRHARMPYVLSRVEDFECEAVQELALGQEPTHGFESPARLFHQKLGDRIKLRDFMLCETHMLLKLLNRPIEFSASIRPEQLPQLSVACLPYCSFLVRVVNVGDC